MSGSQGVMRFYGLVVDENGNGVGGVKAKIGYTYFNPLRPDQFFAGEKHFITETTDDGRFAVAGVKGFNLAVEIEKEGYLSSSHGRGSFIYSAGAVENFRPDENHPVTFHLRKKRGAEPMIQPAQRVSDCRVTARRFL